MPNEGGSRWRMAQRRHCGRRDSEPSHLDASLRTVMNAARRSTMSFTLAEAAKAVGMNKTSILRAIKRGRITGTRDELGQCHVEPVELRLSLRG